MYVFQWYKFLDGKLLRQRVYICVLIHFLISCIYDALVSGALLILERLPLLGLPNFGDSEQLA